MANSKPRQFKHPILPNNSNARVVSSDDILRVWEPGCKTQEIIWNGNAVSVKKLLSLREVSQFINAVMDGTLNYYSAVHESESVDITGDTAVVVGRSYVQAAVFGGGKHYWHLQQTCSLKKTNGNWKITRSVASTY